MVTEKEVWAALREVYDPEVPVNVVDMGLIYEVKVREDGNVYVKMTLTTPACHMAGQFTSSVEDAVKALGVPYVDLELVYDPPWTPEKMTPEGRIELEKKFGKATAKPGIEQY